MKRIVMVLALLVISTAAFAQDKPKPAPAIPAVSSSTAPTAPQEVKSVGGAAAEKKAVASPGLPKEATKPGDAQPITVPQEMVQAIVGPIGRAQYLGEAIALIQKEIDAMNTQGQRAFNAAQALHPDMLIDPKTWTFVVKK